VKFKVDENLPEELSQLFRQAGWDSFTVAEQQLGGAEDSEVARVSNSEHRVLVTFDRGFSNIKAYPPATHPGMIVFRLKSQDKPHVLAVATRLIAALAAREIRNELWVVQKDRIRIRTM
jgi:predicted nuclease of predicted toxin-antitoxin system